MKGEPYPRAPEIFGVLEAIGTGPLIERPTFECVPEIFGALQAKNGVAKRGP